VIEFITLYLGLVLGPQNLEVSVGPDVAAVEIVLDGETIATMTGKPWQIECDLGPRLVPHTLEAVARDDTGRELGRTEQWINLPRPRAEAKLSLEGDSTSSARWARVIWESVDFERPRRVEAFLDGKPLRVEAIDRFPLPKVDPTKIHFLSVNVEFSDSVSAPAELVFGGIYSDTVATELTSVVLESERFRTPAPEQLEGVLLHRGRPLRVVAVEKPPAEIILVRDHSSGTLDTLELLLTTRPGRLPAVKDQLPRVVEKNDWVRLAIPPSDALGQKTDQYDQIPVTGDLAGPPNIRLIDILAHPGPSGSHVTLEEERVADTVLVAGLVASAGNRRRAVLLLSAFDNLDVSRLQPVIVRDYLDSLTVPLMIWRLRPPKQAAPSAGASWGEVIDVSDWGALGPAFRRLRELLDSQIVVCVEGRHLQQEISVAPEARKLRLARSGGAALAAEIRQLEDPTSVSP
jgi:hypothetical protein